MTSALGRKLAAALLTPHTLASLLAFAASLSVFVATRPPTAPEPPTVELTNAEDRLVAADVRLVLVDATGLEWQRAERVLSQPGASARLTAVLAALREALVAEGVWPAELPAPRAFMETVERRTVAVVDMRPPPGLGVSVGQELAILRAVVGTAQLAGASNVAFLRDGQPAATLLGHVTVSSSL